MLAIQCVSLTTGAKMEIIVILYWLALSIAAGMFASIRRNRSGFGWFLFALILTPLLGFVFAAILPVNEPVNAT
jgi:hypothetical protein